MAQYIDKDALVVEMEKRIEEYKSMKIDSSYYDGMIASLEFLRDEFIDTLEVKEVNEVPATIMVNKYGNRFISSWPGLKEYDDFKKGEEIKIVILKNK